ncbi:hypothetical protein AAFF_G00018460 [Aldrovandia affinis]|uniref:Endonuclease domain-containing 1 protein-like n=1 Tax=Aldrovandia affinis TaxID=143900 RepID=A0AAD7WHJ2_9TELE|nr:hypothetical protein AAFF_G00018460 [Aldrovandia affinis]
MAPAGAILVLLRCLYSESLAMNLLYPVSLVLLLPALVVAEVTSFTNCPQFFTQPYSKVSFPTILQGPRYKQICQRHDNIYEFATLYDTTNRIPVYSAYKYFGRTPCTRRPGNWFIEPQLDIPGGSPNMSPEGPNIGQKQALNMDYINSGYHKGHLYPVFQVRKQCTADATFTLTNGAPQVPNFNQGAWKKIEREIAEVLSTNQKCKGNPVYVVTGTVPGNILMNGWVNIPSYFWSAYCCLDNNNVPQISNGYIGMNVIHSKVDGPITVAALEGKLSDNNHYATPFSVFGGRC